MKTCVLLAVYFITLSFSTIKKRESLCSVSSYKELNDSNCDSIDLYLNASFSSQSEEPRQSRLKEIRTFWLLRNGLKEFPEVIHRCSNLKHLMLGANQLTSIPEEIAKLENLQSLNLHDNLLQELPEELTEIPIQTLVISNNKFEHLPDVVFRMKSLRSLAICFNQIPEDEVIRFMELHPEVDVFCYDHQ